MPGGVPAPAGRGRVIGEAQALAARVALTIALLAGPALAQDEPQPPPKLDGEVEASVQAFQKALKVRVLYPTSDKDGERWAKTVKAVIEKGLPALGRQAHFDPGPDALEVRLAFESTETEGYDALLKGEKLFVRKACDRKEPGMYRAGYRGYWVLYALARMFTEQALRPEWLRAGVAHLLVFHALKEVPTIYDARAFRDDEILPQVAKLTDETPLDQWTPMPPGGGAAGVAVEQPVALPQVAKAFAHLYQIDVLADGAVRKAFSETGAGGGGGAKGKDFIDSVIKASTEKITIEHFAGWAWADPAGATLVPKLDKTDVIDSDADGLLNFEEVIHGTDKAKADTDADGIIDAEEIEDGTDPKQKAPSKARVRVDGNRDEWKRLKKFAFQDKEGDAKENIRGADVHKVNICADQRYIYVAIEADAFDNAEVAYQICFDAGDEVPFDSKDPAEQKKRAWNYIVGFRGDGSRPWIGDTRSSKDTRWAEWKNNKRLWHVTKEKVAEVRIPLSAMELPPKFMLMVYTTARGGALTPDSVLSEPIDIEKWRH